MVKAVNKLILEINNTENEYFEKAVLYIRPDKANDNKLGESAEKYLRRLSTGGDRKEQNKGHLFISVLVNAAVAVFSAMLTAVVLLLV